MLCLELVRLNIIKLFIKFNVILKEILMGDVMECEKWILKFIWRSKGLRIIIIIKKCF